jgi:hypothetical protein
MSKIDILRRLLDDGHINVSELIILLTEDIDGDIAIHITDEKHPNYKLLIL